MILEYTVGLIGCAPSDDGAAESPGYVGPADGRQSDGRERRGRLQGEYGQIVRLMPQSKMIKC